MAFAAGTVAFLTFTAVCLYSVVTQTQTTTTTSSRLFSPSALWTHSFTIHRAEQQRTLHPRLLQQQQLPSATLGGDNPWGILAPGQNIHPQRTLHVLQYQLPQLPLKGDNQSGMNNNTLVSLPAASVTRKPNGDTTAMAAKVSSNEEHFVVVPHFEVDRRRYRWDRSTEDNYRINVLPSQPQQDGTSDNQADVILERSRYSHIRRHLDYNYHAKYNERRQAFQDDILDAFLAKAVTPRCTDEQLRQGPRDPARKKEHWIVFTAGVMGAGKTHTMKWLYDQGYFPLDTFVIVDPDQIRNVLPEYKVYAEQVPEKAGEFTRKEAGFICEILTQAALQEGKNVLVDGSLRDSVWYQGYFAELRKLYPDLLIGIFHITAPVKAVYERAANRAKITGRVVPTALLEKTMEQVPKSVSILRDHVDCLIELHNPSNGDDAIQLTSATWSWDRMQQQFSSCS